MLDGRWKMSRSTTRNENGNHGFNVATLVQVGLIPILAAVITLSGFYYVTGSTLNRHDKELDVLTLNGQNEAKAREAVRNEYILSQQKINENLGKLDTRLAVSETKQEVANQTLNRIADELSKISASTSPLLRPRL